MPGRSPEDITESIRYAGDREGDIKCCIKGDRKTQTIAFRARETLHDYYGVPHPLISIFAYSLSNFPLLKPDDKLRILKSIAKAKPSN